MIFHLGDYTLDADIWRTAAFYEGPLSLPTDIRCVCDGCQNFVKAIGGVSPAVLSFLTSLGIRPSQPCEAFRVTDTPDAEGQFLYGGWYHIAGTVTGGGKDGYRPDPASDFTVWLLSGDQKTGPRENGFPSPCVEMSFSCRLPWVTDCFPCSIIDELRTAGIVFLPGMTEAAIAEIEKVYGFRFPHALRRFYRLGLPTGKGFPDWSDLSGENIAAIKEWMEAPLRRLRMDRENGFRLPAWEARGFDAALAEAPRLIPIYSHRYLPLTEGMEDPPVLSTVGADTICYSANLEDYLRREFLGGGAPSEPIPVDIPFWGELVDAN